MRARLEDRLRRISIRPGVAAAGIFALVILALLWPALVGGRVLASTNTLFLSPPFSAFAPDGWRENSNLLISDSPYYFVPMLELVRDRIHDGVLPLWNQSILSGAPLLANQQSAVLSPFNLPLWVLPFSTALGWVAALKLFVAALGTYLFARRLRLGFWPAIVAGVAFGLCGFMISWLSSAHTNVASLLPWALLAVELILAEGSLRSTLALAAVTCLYLLGGHTESAMFVAFAVLLYAAMRLVLDVAPEHRRARAAMVVGGSLLGVGLAAVTLVPFLDALSTSADKTVRGSDQGAAPGAGLISIFFPDYWGRPTGANVVGPSNFSERTFYAGAITLLLAGIALSTPRSVRRFAPLLVLGVLGLLSATDATDTSKIVSDLPLIGQTVIARMHFLFGFALAILGAAGLDALIKRLVPLRYLWTALAIAAGLGLAVLLAISPSPGDFGSALGGLPGGALKDRAAVLHTAAVLWWLVLLCPLALVALAAQRRWLPRAGLGPAVAGVVVLDMLAFAWGFQPAVPKDQFYKPVPPAVRFLQREQGSDRVTATYQNLPTDVGMHYGLRDIRGKDHPKARRMVELFRRTLNRNQRATLPLGVAAVTKDNDQVLAMMAVQFLLIAHKEAAPSTRDLTVAYRGRDAVVYRVRSALPRTYVARSVALARNGDAALDRVSSPAFNPRRTTVLESRDRSLRGARGSVRLTRDDPQRVTIDATLSRPGVVVLSDSYAKGWTPRVDGKAVDPIRANYVYRGVRVPAGRHTIEWRYRPASFTRGVVLSGVSLLVFLGLAAFALLRGRLSPPGRDPEGRGPWRAARRSLRRRKQYAGS